jgi:hypothetical protein
LPPEILSGYVADNVLMAERMGHLEICQADSRILTFLAAFGSPFAANLIKEQKWLRQ